MDELEYNPWQDYIPPKNINKSPAEEDVKPQNLQRIQVKEASQKPIGKRDSWIMYHQQFKFKIVHRPRKENKNADALSRIPEVQCFFIGDENKGREENSERNFSENIPKNDPLKQNEPVDDDYEEESEDNNKNFNEDLEQIENEVKKIRHLNEQRNEYWEKLNQTLREIEKVKGEVKELLERRIIRRRTMIILPNNGSDDETDEQNMEHRSSHPYSCCG